MDTFETWCQLFRLIHFPQSISKQCFQSHYIKNSLKQRWLLSDSWTCSDSKILSGPVHSCQFEAMHGIKFVHILFIGKRERV